PPNALAAAVGQGDLPAGFCRELWQFEFAPSEIEVLPADERLEWVLADLVLARHERAAVGPDVGALAPPDHGLDSRDHLLGMARLGDPVVGAEAKRPHPLCDGRAPGAHDEAEPRDPLAHALDVLPRLGPEQADVEDERVQA